MRRLETTVSERTHLATYRLAEEAQHQFDTLVNNTAGMAEHDKTAVIGEATACVGDALKIASDGCVCHTHEAYTKLLNYLMALDTAIVVTRHIPPPRRLAHIKSELKAAFRAARSMEDD